MCNFLRARISFKDLHTTVFFKKYKVWHKLNIWLNYRIAYEGKASRNGLATY